MNFNFSNKNEYTLNTSLTFEMINLYGIGVKYIITEKVNLDLSVFGDYSHLKTNNSDIFEVNMLPEFSEDWESAEYAFTNFGLMNYENMNLFVSVQALTGISDISKMVGDLIVFPNNKIMEITHADLTTPGINNLFTYKDSKSVIKLSCKPYSFKLIEELNTDDISIESDESYESLENYFSELIEENTDQDIAAETTPTVDTVERGDEEDSIVKKPIVDKTESDVWGKFS